MKTKRVFFFAKRPAAILVACLIFQGLMIHQLTGQSITREGALERFTADLKYLASDELQGRLPGTPEMEKAVEYIVAAYKSVGLKPAMPDGTYLQTFDVGRTNAMVPDSGKLSLMGPNNQAIELKYGSDFTTQISQNNFSIEGDLVFVGYGITAKDHNFDEYRDLDVKDKIVVMIRKEPQQDDEKSVFDGKQQSTYASVRSKCTTAREKGVKGIIFVNDVVTAPEAAKDGLAVEELFGASTFGIPFMHVKRSTIDQVLTASPLSRPDGKKISSLADAEKAIDSSLESYSQVLTGWRAKGAAEFAKKQILTHNLIGVIEGEGPLADETVVIGGHYDHLGLGAFGSRSPDAGKKIHNGADDNATGTAGIMELVRRFQTRPNKPARRLVFICFTAEEMGLLGAQHYVENPVFPLDKTVAMLNYDMIGWLRDDKLTLFSWDSSPEFSDLIEKANEEFKLDLQKPPGGFAGSDHLPFQAKNIPVMFLHTGLTGTYHTPEDEFESINCAGAVKVIDYTDKVIDVIASTETRPTFSGSGAGRGGQRVRLGVTLEETEAGEVMVVAITEDSLAAKAGFEIGDVIKKVADKETKKRREVNQIVSANVNKKVKFVVNRKGADTVI
ncbi:MAG: M20/M25/M40 family metallo-hydrolase, partial [Pirellulaceae bacterium]